MFGSALPSSNIWTILAWFLWVASISAVSPACATSISTVAAVNSIINNKFTYYLALNVNVDASLY